MTFNLEKLAAYVDIAHEFSKISQYLTNFDFFYYKRLILGKQVQQLIEMKKILIVFNAAKGIKYPIWYPD